MAGAREEECNSAQSHSPQSRKCDSKKYFKMGKFPITFPYEGEPNLLLIGSNIKH